MTEPSWAQADSRGDDSRDEDSRDCDSREEDSRMSDDSPEAWMMQDEKANTSVLFLK